MRVRHVLAVLVVFFAIQTVKTYAQVAATWTDSTGNWSNPANWSTNTVPNNSGGTTYDVVINGTGSDMVTYDLSGVVINSLSIGSGENFEAITPLPGNQVRTLTTGALTLASDGRLDWFGGGQSGKLATGPITLTDLPGAVFGAVFSVSTSSVQVTGDFQTAPSTVVSFQNSTDSISGSLIGSSTIFEEPTLTIRQSIFDIAGNLQYNQSGMEASDSVITVGGNVSLFGGRFVDTPSFKVGGDFSLGDGSDFVLQGAISSLSVGGNFTAVGGGPSTVFQIRDGATVQVQGDFDAGQARSILLDNHSALSVLGSFGLSTGMGVYSYMGVYNSSTLNVAKDLSNAGDTVFLDSTSVLVARTYSQSSGSTNVFGKLQTSAYSQSGGSTTIETGGKLTADSFSATGGAVQGTGTIVGNVSMAGTLTPGLPGAPGTFNITGNYQQIGQGTLVDLMSPLSRSLLSVSGNAMLGTNSVLQIDLLNGFNPLGQTFDVMNYNALFGQFSNGSSFWDDGFLWKVTYGQNEVEVTAIAGAPLPTPEPSSFLFLGLGLLASAALAFRRGFLGLVRGSCGVT